VREAGPTGESEEETEREREREIMQVINQGASLGAYLDLRIQVIDYLLQLDHLAHLDVPVGLYPQYRDEKIKHGTQ
jgi:hypothetical protein